MIVSLAITILPVGAQTISAGQVLVATRTLHEPTFSKSVVLLIYVEKTGVMGLMLNRPVKHLVSEVLPEAKSGKEFAWLGGPVPVGVFALSGGSNPPAESSKVLPGVFLVTSRKQIELMPGNARLRVYAGNCGWTLPQLRNEMGMGVWRLLPGTADEVFDKQSESLWDRLIASEFVWLRPPLAPLATRDQIKPWP